MLALLKATLASFRESITITLTCQYLHFLLMLPLCSCSVRRGDISLSQKSGASSSRHTNNFFLMLKAGSQQRDIVDARQERCQPAMEQRITTSQNLTSVVLLMHDATRTYLRRVLNLFSGAICVFKSVRHRRGCCDNRSTIFLV